MMVVEGVTGLSFTIRWGSWFPFGSVIAWGYLNPSVALVTLGSSILFAYTERITAR